MVTLLNLSIMAWLPYVALVLFFSFFSLSTLLSHSGIAAHMTGIRAASLGAPRVLTRVHQHLRLPSFAVTLMLFTILLLGAYFFADVPWYIGLLFVLAPIKLHVYVPRCSERLLGYSMARLGLIAAPALLARIVAFWLVY